MLPPGFHRIRYYGLLGNRHRREHLVQCRHLLGTAAVRPEPLDPDPIVIDYRDRYEALTGRSLRVCPRCQGGPMQVVECLVRASRRPPRLDTS